MFEYANPKQQKRDLVPNRMPASPLPNLTSISDVTKKQVSHSPGSCFNNTNMHSRLKSTPLPTYAMPIQCAGDEQEEKEDKSTLKSVIKSSGWGVIAGTASLAMLIGKFSIAPLTIPLGSLIAITSLICCLASVLKNFIWKSKSVSKKDRIIDSGLGVTASGATAASGVATAASSFAPMEMSWLGSASGLLYELAALLIALRGLNSISEEDEEYRKKFERYGLDAMAAVAGALGYLTALFSAPNIVTIFVFVNELAVRGLRLIRTWLQERKDVKPSSSVSPPLPAPSGDTAVSSSAVSLEMPTVSSAVPSDTSAATSSLESTT